MGAEATDADRSTAGLLQQHCVGLDAGMGLLFLILVMRQIDSNMDSIRIFLSLITAIILGGLFGFNYALIGTALVAIMPVHLIEKQGS